MTATDLTYAIGLPPTRAIEYFKAKGYAISWDWKDVWREAHVEAFTVAKAISMDVLAGIRKEVQAAIDNGTTIEKFRQTLEPRLKAQGWWGKDHDGNVLGTPHRLATIFRTNLQGAYNRGRYEDMIQNTDHRPWWQYRAILDVRTRPTHRALDSMVFRYDDPFWQTHLPPLGFNCRCRVAALTDKDKERLGVMARQGTMVKDTVTIDGKDYGITGYRDPQTNTIVHADLGWDYNKLHGFTYWPPDLPPIPDAFADVAAVEYQRRLDKLAQNTGTDPQSLRWKLKEKAQQMVDGADPYLRMTKADLADFIANDEFRPDVDPTLLGALYRDKWEQIGKKTLGQRIHAQGYLSKDANGNLADASLFDSGQVAVRLKRATLKRATVQQQTIAQLEATNIPAMVPRPALAPDEMMLNLPLRGEPGSSPLEQKSIDDTIYHLRLNFTDRPTLDQIAEVISSEKLSKRLKRRLDALGIPWREVEHKWRELDDFDMLDF